MAKPQPSRPLPGTSTSPFYPFYIHGLRNVYLKKSFSPLKEKIHNNPHSFLEKIRGKNQDLGRGSDPIPLHGHKGSHCAQTLPWLRASRECHRREGGQRVAVRHCDETLRTKQNDRNHRDVPAGRPQPAVVGPVSANGQESLRHGTSISHAGWHETKTELMSLRWGRPPRQPDARQADGRLSPLARLNSHKSPVTSLGKHSGNSRALLETPGRHMRQGKAVSWAAGWTPARPPRSPLRVAVTRPRPHARLRSPGAFHTLCLT